MSEKGTLKLGQKHYSMRTTPDYRIHLRICSVDQNCVEERVFDTFEEFTKFCSAQEEKDKKILAKPGI